MFNLKYVITMKRSMVLLTLAAALGCMCLGGCSKKERLTPVGERVCHCGSADALHELEWLRNTVERLESLRGKQRAEVSVCRYDGGKEGFLVAACIDCPDLGSSLHDCEGNALGTLFGIDGHGLDYYGIDPASVRCVYRNYTEVSARDRLCGRVLKLERFVDRATGRSEYPATAAGQREFWLLFHPDGTVEGGGVNYLAGRYELDEEHHIGINIHAMTEVYDATGWEDRMLAALNEAIICDFWPDHIRIYYHYTNTYMEFRTADGKRE